MSGNFKKNLTLWVLLLIVTSLACKTSFSVGDMGDINLDNSQSYRLTKAYLVQGDNIDAPPQDTFYAPVARITYAGWIDTPAKSETIDTTVKWWVVDIPSDSQYNNTIITNDDESGEIKHADNPNLLFSTLIVDAAGGLPAGEYRVQVFINDELVDERNFYVR